MFRVFQNHRVQTSDKEPDKTNSKGQGEIIQEALKTKTMAQYTYFKMRTSPEIYKMQIKTTTTIHFSTPKWQSFQTTMDTIDTGEKDEVVALLYYFREYKRNISFHKRTFDIYIHSFK